MESLSINVRLRPIRFAFVVRPEDKVNLQKIFHVNTCLWGGIYNPIIPFFKRVPVWWERKGIKFDNARQIINGYLDYFEPDFVVEAEKGLTKGFGIDVERIFQLPDILPRDGQRDDRGHGQTVMDLYRRLYRDEFQFVTRHKHGVFSAKAISPSFESLVACLFGAFPEQRNLKYFGRAFQDAFDPEQISLDGKALDKIYRARKFSALRMGCEKLDISYNDHSQPTLFILDAHQPKDLLDFWNYRAVHQSCVAIPRQWLPELSSFCKKFILHNYRPLPGNSHGVMIHPKIMFSRSISDKDIEELHAKYLRVDKEGANLLQTWYPPIWRPSPEFMVRRTRPTITAATKNFDITVDMDNPRIRFESLHPDFAERFGSNDRWANIIHLEDWSYKDRIATVFPTDFRVEAVPHFGLGSEHLLSTNEGLVTFPRFTDIPYSWTLIEGKNAIELWLKKAKILCRLSESGRSTQQIIQTLGGFFGVRSLSHKGIIELLDSMARSSITRSAQQKEFENKINVAIKGDIWSNKILETLVEHKAVELGLELKCSKCGSWGWYALNQLNAVINCNLCLSSFGFPLTNPSDSKCAKWAYRVIGPFALPKYADGGYAAALAIRFFADVIGQGNNKETTWSPGQELTFPDGKKVEVDFLIWYQRKHLLSLDQPTQFIFGEAKSFGKDAFKDEDVERMKFLGERYPGAVLVFATMKEAAELSKDEIRRIRRLAEWGREYDKERRQSRAPVIVLTGTELFTPYRLEIVWKDKGGDHEAFIKPAYVRLDNLETLADLTQQLYLGMPSYSSWRSTKWKKKDARRKKNKI